MEIIAQSNNLYLPLTGNSKLTDLLDKISLQDMLTDGIIQKHTDEKGQTYLKLTDKGRKHLSVHYIDYKLDLLEFEKILESYYGVINQSLEGKGIKSLCIYGASDTAISIYNYLLHKNFTILCIIDDDELKQGKTFLNSPVVSFEDSTKFNYEAVVIATIAFENTIYERLQGNLNPNIEIIRLFDHEI